MEKKNHLNLKLEEMLAACEDDPGAPNWGVPGQWPVCIPEENDPLYRFWTNIASSDENIPYTYITGITKRVEREYIID